jgi:hypothetical protein
MWTVKESDRCCCGGASGGAVGGWIGYDDFYANVKEFDGRACSYDVC